MKRLVAAVLWCYAGWTAGSFIEYMTGIPSATIVGVAFGASGAALFVGDPLRRIWTVPRTEIAPA